MLRQDAQGRTTFAGTPGRPGVAGAPLRHRAARHGAALLRILVAPLVAVVAAAAGVVFVVLLPVCGIASIAEGIARSAWRFLRGTPPHPTHPTARRI